MPDRVAAVHVRGLRELQTALAHADRGTRTVVRRELREVAQPVQRDAEGLARQRIPKIGPKWPRMRVGVTRRLVYVAPVQRGVKGRGPDPRRRPNFADLLMNRAMEPALQQHQAQIADNLDRALDRISVDFNH